LTTHQEGFIDTSFGRIAYRECGAGPVALFLHGLPLSSYEWRDVMADLAASRRCIALHQMGLGHSVPRDPGDLSYAAQAHMIAEFLAAAAIDDVDVVGNDTGGGVSQLFLAHYPHKVRSLTLTNCEVHDCWPNELLQGFYAGVKSGAVPSLMQTMLTDLELARAQLGALIYEDAATLTAATVQIYIAPIVASAERIQAFISLCDWETSRRQLIDCAPLLRANKVPTRIIWGMADVVFDAGPSLDWLENNFGNIVKISRAPGAKLFFPEERPQYVSGLLAEFWRALA
jgi:pimeloyl-ACP methyl ester carboxylesterase